MKLPPLPEPYGIGSYPYPDTYTTVQMLAYRAETVEACAQVLLESGFKSTGISAYESLSEKLRNLK
jgi:hypothetical protein